MECSVKEYDEFKTEIIKHFKDTEIHFCVIKIKITTLTERKDIDQVLEDFHSSRLSGHQGVNRMMGRIKSRYQWTGMTSDIKKFVKTCSTCQFTKKCKSTKLPMQVTSTAKYPFERVALDVVGPLPTADQGHKYLLTFQDDLTKFLGAEPIYNQEENTIAEIIVEKIVLQYGMPQTILSDLGGSFISDLMARVYKLIGIRKTNTSPWKENTE